MGGDEAAAVMGENGPADGDAVSSSGGWQQLACGTAPAPVETIGWVQACDGVLAADEGIFPWHNHCSLIIHRSSSASGVLNP